MALFGVEPLDRLLGEVPEGASLLLVAEPDVDGPAMLLQAAGHALREGRDAVYVVTTRSPDSTRAALRGLGFDGDSDRLLFVDAYSGMMAQPGDNPVRDRSNLSEVATRLAQVSRDHADALVCFDSLSALVDQTSFSEFEVALPAIEDALRRFRMSLCLFTSWPYDQAHDRWTDGFDGVVRLYGVEERIVRNQAFRIDRSRWREPAEAVRIVTVTRPGGVLVVVPKIVVTGPHDAGKTTFVHTTSNVATSTERMGTTVALDKGRYEGHGVVADLFGTPGQRRFDPMIDSLLEQAQGAVLVVDANRPETFQRARELLEKVRRRGLQVVVAANKQDLPDAIAAKEVSRALGVPAYPCRSDDPASLRAVLERLILEMLEGGAGH